MGKEFERFSGAASSVGVLKDTPAFELGGPVASKKGGCGGGGCGCAGGKNKGRGGSAPPMIAGLRGVMEHAQRALRSVPNADSSGGLGQAFDALQAMADNLEAQLDAIQKR